MTQVLVLNLGDTFGPEYQTIAQALRSAGIRVSIYYGSETRVGGQLGYADRLGAHCAVILGERELSDGSLGLKDLRTKTQQQVPFLQGQAVSPEALVSAVVELLRRV
jgi:histidyl-tRNA synthetase